MRESQLAVNTMEFSDQDLRVVLNRALRTVAIAILVLAPILWIAWGWRSMVLFLVGGAIAATGIIEWRQLMSAVLARLSAAGEHASPPGSGAVLVFCPPRRRRRGPLC